MYEHWISIASLILSVIAIYWSNKLQKQSNDLQERIVRIEEEREYERKVKSRQANLRAELRKEEMGYKLYLINSGEAEARNISIKINGKPLKYSLDHDALKPEQGGASVYGLIPQHISPSSELGYFIWVSPECYPNFEIELKWDDDYQKDRIRKDVLTF
ncbi:hypothetical protein V7D15_12520 [Thermoanaerobacter thermohydrosulfuricus]